MVLPTHAFNLPSPYETETEELDRRQKMAQLLQAQAAQSPEKFSYKGIEAHVSPLSYLAKALESYTSSADQKTILEERKALGERYRQEGTDDMNLFANMINQPAVKAVAAVPGQAAYIPQPHDYGEPPRRGLDNLGRVPAVAPVAPVAARIRGQIDPEMIRQFKTPGMQQFALAQLIEQRKKPDDVKLSPGESLFEYNEEGELVLKGRGKDKDVGTWGEPFILDGAPVQRNSVTGEVRQVTSRRAAVQPLGDNAYVNERGKGQAQVFAENEKSAASAHRQIVTLTRFIDASKRGVEGGAQPIISAVQNFIASFGYAPESLKSVRIMEQAIGDILKNKMDELGARGLTDKDMEILGKSLPRVAIDADSRVAIAEIMIKNSTTTLEDYSTARDEEALIYPSLKTLEPGWFKDWKKHGRAPRKPANVSQEMWDVMTSKEKAAFP